MKYFPEFKTFETVFYKNLKMKNRNVFAINHVIPVWNENKDEIFIPRNPETETFHLSSSPIFTHSKLLHFRVWKNIFRTVFPHPANKMIYTDGFKRFPLTSQYLQGVRPKNTYTTYQTTTEVDAVLCFGVIRRKSKGCLPAIFLESFFSEHQIFEYAFVYKRAYRPIELTKG